MIRAFIRRRPITTAGVGLYAAYLGHSLSEDWGRCREQEIPRGRLLMAKFVPWRWTSRLAGFLADCHVPINLRRWLYGSYAQVMGCNLLEAEHGDLRVYATFNDFFARRLRPELRPIDRAAVVSPCDGQVVFVGQVSSLGSAGEQVVIPGVKGLDIYLRTLVGSATYDSIAESVDWQHQSLHFCSIYLGPGDYHRFHAPADGWRLQHRQSLGDRLLTVAPWALRLLPHVPLVNERLVLDGTIPGRLGRGRLLMVPVGATHVGSIQLSAPLESNLKKGQEVGHFLLGGSMIILLYVGDREQAKLTVAPGQRVKMGQALCCPLPNGHHRFFSILKSLSGIF